MSSVAGSARGEGGVMSGLGRWSLGAGLVLVVVAVVLAVAGVVGGAVIVGLLGLVGLGIAGYDALYEALSRRNLRRRGERARRPGEAR